MSTLARFWDSDVAYSFRQSPVAIGATIVALVMVFSAAFAAWVAPHNPFDLATLNLLDASLPPAPSISPGPAPNWPRIRAYKRLISAIEPLLK